MARPTKEGLEYFPLDTNFDDEVMLIDAKFGCVGIGILIKIWQIIYEKGYFLRWTERELLLYRNRINADINLINDVINECLKWGIFDEGLYEKYQILTSKGVQKRFVEATQRRKEVSFIKEYLLIKNIKEMYSKTVNVNINSINVDNNRVNADIYKQSKVKESKVKETESSTPPIPPQESEENNFKGEKDIFEIYQEGLGKMSRKASQELIAYKQTLSDEVLLLALDEAIDRGVNNWRYVRAILERCKAEGVISKADWHKRKPKSRDKPKQEVTFDLAEYERQAMSQVPVYEKGG